MISPARAGEHGVRQGVGQAEAGVADAWSGTSRTASPDPGPAIRPTTAPATNTASALGRQRGRRGSCRRLSSGRASTAISTAPVSITGAPPDPVAEQARPGGSSAAKPTLARTVAIRACWKVASSVRLQVRGHDDQEGVAGRRPAHQAPDAQQRWPWRPRRPTASHGTVAARGRPRSALDPLEGRRLFQLAAAATARPAPAAAPAGTASASPRRSAAPRSATAASTRRDAGAGQQAERHGERLPGPVQARAGPAGRTRSSPRPRRRTPRPPKPLQDPDEGQQPRARRRRPWRTWAAAPISVVAPVISSSTRIRVGRRPIRSPSRPNTAAPTGRKKKASANDA